MYSAFRARCDDRRPRWVLRIGLVSIAARLDSAMTKRSVPTQVLTILPSLSLAPCSACLRPDLIEGRGNASFAQAAAGAYAWPEVSTAQTILAVLPGGLGGLRHHRHFHRPPSENAALPLGGPVVARAGVAQERDRPEGEQFAQPAFPLPAHAPYSPLAGGGCLARGHAAPGGEVARASEPPPLPDRRHHRMGGQKADAFECGRAAACPDRP